MRDFWKIEEKINMSLSKWQICATKVYHDVTEKFRQNPQIKLDLQVQILQQDML